MTMRNKLYYWLGVFATLFIVGCEDLSDTYDEFAGDGRIRYLGRCGDVEVVPGWERLRVSWKNSMDATVKWTKITWQSEEDAQPFERLVERETVTEESELMDTIYLENLHDGIYTITVSNMAADSTESLVETLYVRPYTMDHEDLRSFTRGITNFYFIGENSGKLVVLLDETNENLRKVVLNYWGTDGKEYTWDIQEHMTDTLEYWGMMTDIRDYMQILPEEGVDIDFTKPVTVVREGRVPGCIDDVVFPDETLSRDERILSVAFTNWLVKNYGQDWEAKNVLNTIEEVELDYDMNSFQDLLYLPNLKKVVLGKNRFMAEGYTNENMSVTDNYTGLVTLQFLKETRSDFTVDWYNNQYFDAMIEDENSMFWGMLYYDVLATCGKISDAWYGGSWVNVYNSGENLAFEPEISPIEVADDWEITCSDTLYNEYKTGGAGWLLDDDPTTYFEPGLTLAGSVYEVEIDMKQPQTLHGFKVVQPLRNPAGEDELNRELSYLTPSVQIEVSEDGYVWEPATYEDGGITVGDALGETTFIEIPEEYQSRNVRYVRFTMANRHTLDLSGGSPLYSLRLGDIVLY